MIGGSRNDTIGGDGGDDSLNGGSGADMVSGGDGNDTIVGVEIPGVGGADWLDGGEGTDLLRLDWSGFTAGSGRNARASSAGAIDAASSKSFSVSAAKFTRYASAPCGKSATPARANSSSG